MEAALSGTHLLASRGLTMTILIAEIVHDLVAVPFGSLSVAVDMLRNGVVETTVINY